MKGQLAIIFFSFFFAAIRSKWSPRSKHAVSKGTPKPNLAKIQVKLVLLKNKLTFWYHKVALQNWDYLQNKSACNNFFIYFFCQTFCHIWIYPCFKPTKNISNNYSELICHKNFPQILSSACFTKNFIIFLLKQKKSVKFGEFWIVQAFEDASKKITL